MQDTLLYVVAAAAVLWGGGLMIWAGFNPATLSETAEAAASDSDKTPSVAFPSEETQPRRTAA